MACCEGGEVFSLSIEWGDDGKRSFTFFIFDCGAVSQR